MSQSKPIVIINKFPAKCRVCGKTVNAFEGVAIKEGSCKWQAAHRQCESVLADPIFAEREARREEIKRQERERAAAQQKAQEERDLLRKTLMEQTGLVLSSRKLVSHEQHSYSDTYVESYEFTGTGTVEEFNFLLGTSAESGYGKLRWSNGAHVSRIDGNLVFVYESISLCD